MKRPTLLPEHQLETVVAALYAQADDAGWDNLGPRDRSRMYSDWVEPTDPIGQILAQYMTPEAARSWIKDGPMKEYARANRGTGRYASFGRRGGTTPADIVRHALGETAHIVPGTEAVKPLRSHAVDDQGARTLVLWGDRRAFKDLLWAALRAATDDHTPVIVILEPPGKVTPAQERRQLDAIATRCQVTVTYMREILGSRTEPHTT